MNDVTLFITVWKLLDFTLTQIFYVKSILTNLKSQKVPIWQFQVNLFFILINFGIFQSRYEIFWSCQNGLFWDLTKLISRNFRRGWKTLKFPHCILYKRFLSFSLSPFAFYFFMWNWSLDVAQPEISFPFFFLYQEIYASCNLIILMKKVWILSHLKQYIVIEF